MQIKWKFKFKKNIFRSDGSEGGNISIRLTPLLRWTDSGPLTVNSHEVDNEEDGHSSADDGQGDQHAAQQVLSDASGPAASAVILAPMSGILSVLRYRLYRHCVQLLLTLQPSQQFFIEFRCSDYVTSYFYYLFITFLFIFLIIFY